MEFMILDSAGNALAAFDDQLLARAVLHSMVAIEPEAAEHVAMLSYDDEGMPVGEAVMAIDVPAPVALADSTFVVSQITSGLLREPQRARTQYVPASMAPLVPAT